jgi:hypothetical protein
MIADLLLLDVTPGPPSPGVGIGELIFVAIVVLMLTGAAIVGFVFLVRRLTKTAGSGTRVVVGDACLNLDSLGSRSNRVTSPAITPTAQPENNPNHP